MQLVWDEEDSAKEGAIGFFAYSVALQAQYRYAIGTCIYRYAMNEYAPGHF